MLLFVIYLAGVADNFIAAAGFLCAFLAMASVPTAVCCAEATSRGNDAVSNLTKRILKYIMPAFVLMLLIAVLTPSSKTIKYMAAAKVGELVVQSEQFKGAANEVGILAGKSAKALNKMLDDYNGSK